MNREVNKFISKIRNELEVSLHDLGVYETLAEEDGPTAPGESGATNSTDVLDAFDSYIGTLVDAILDDYDIDEDEAYDIVFDIADEMAEDGDLPELPAEDDIEGISMWMGKAKSMGFSAVVLANVEDWAEDE